MKDLVQNERQGAMLWAPWRMEFVGGPKAPGCFLCRIGQGEDGGDEKNFVLWRGKTCYLVLNRYPYNGGHLMAVPYRHVADVNGISEEEWVELGRAVKLAEAALSAAMGPQGFNVGINQGVAAGAGAAGPLHVHVVPRWSGASNFLPVVGGVRVMSQGLGAAAVALRKALGTAIGPDGLVAGGGPGGGWEA